MPLDLGSLKLPAGPTQLGAPDDLEAIIIDFIDRAQEYLFIAVQELESRSIAEAILRAEGRGVRVWLILAGKYLTVDKALADPWSAAASAGASWLACVERDRTTRWGWPSWSSWTQIRPVQSGWRPIGIG